MRRDFLLSPTLESLPSNTSQPLSRVKQSLVKIAFIHSSVGTLDRALLSKDLQAPMSPTIAVNPIHDRDVDQLHRLIQTRYMEHGERAFVECPDVVMALSCLVKVHKDLSLIRLPSWEDAMTAKSTPRNRKQQKKSKQLYARPCHAQDSNDCHRVQILRRRTNNRHTGLCTSCRRCLFKADQRIQQSSGVAAPTVRRVSSLASECPADVSAPAQSALEVPITSSSDTASIIAPTVSFDAPMSPLAQQMANMIQRHQRRISLVHLRFHIASLESSTEGPTAVSSAEPTPAASTMVIDPPDSFIPVPTTYASYTMDDAPRVSPATVNSSEASSVSPTLSREPSSTAGGSLDLLVMAALQQDTETK